MDKSLKCLLVGAGQLGSRYLQGLSRVGFPLKITVVDPSSAALEQAQLRLSEFPREQHHSVKFMNSVGNEPQQYDLAMVVTPAHCRKELVSEINRHHYINAWILEKLLAQSSQDVNELVNELSTCSRVWVNTPRRIMRWHQEISRDIVSQRAGSLRVSVNGGNWGMACNSIHFIDLVSWWTQSQVTGVDGDSLGSWTHSKRKGFWEVLGSINVTYSDGSNLHLKCDESNKPLRIEVEALGKIWFIEESVGRAVAPCGKQIRGNIEFQSELTTRLVEQILITQTCCLPALLESANQHIPLLDTLLSHWNIKNPHQDKRVPIT